ncbi:hypothetical protein TNCV_1471051 [Trichonephila clavipes]|nr:hypothetical protein TNCV_1471051 [Trichonephila clavipes]
MSPTEERRDEARNIRTRQNPFGPQERQTRISKANYDIEARKDKILKNFTKTELITVCTILGLNCAGSAKELSEHIFKNLSDLASLKNNFTEQLTDDEDSAPFFARIYERRE